jgi:hypothetical protein
MAARGQVDAPGAENRRMAVAVVEAFKEATGFPVTAVKENTRLPAGGADAVVKLGNKTLMLAVKRTLTPATLGQAQAQIARFGGRGVIVTHYVAPAVAARLKELEVPFMETPAPRERRVRAFRATGLKVIFALLCRPDLITAPYREIARAAGVALGAVGWVLNDLKHLGHLHESKTQGRVLEDRQRLIDQWVEGYARELRPKLRPRRYQVANPDWWKKENLAALDMWLAGEPAARVLTQHLRPEVVTVYGDTHFADLARKIHAAKHEHGNLEVLQKFWRFEVPQLVGRIPHAPPLLIYADLMATGDARNLETAKLLRERFLDKA